MDTSFKLFKIYLQFTRIVQIIISFKIDRNAYTKENTMILVKFRKIKDVMLFVCKWQRSEQVYFKSRKSILFKYPNN